MKCPRCEHETEVGAKFCEECGAPFARVCGNCGHSLSPRAKFCPECAHPTGLGPAAGPTLRFTSPESHTPRYLAEKILTSKAALEGERKHVTVLFADLKGSMELLAERDAEEARKLLDPVLEHMMEAVHRYEGTVNQVMGDGVMALFGAPLAHEDHAVRACYAALRMQETVKRYADGVFRTYGVPVRIRVGLNSGEVVVRSIGSDLHMDYTAVGQTTHLAARMEQIADPGTIRLTSDTLHLAEGFVEVRALGPTPVKGLATPVDVYELTDASPVRSRLHVAAARGLTQFVGRDAEMDGLFASLERARAGHGQIVALVGEPGVGKSRLYWEFTHSHRTHSCFLLEAPSVSYGKASTYLPVIELLKRYMGIEPRDDGRKIREKVTGKLFSLDRALEPCLSPLLWLLDAPVEEPSWERLDSLLRRQRLRDAIRHVLLREAREQPLVLVFEDLHWIDEETQALLDGLVESLPATRMLLLVNYRPEYRHGWGSKTFYTQLRLDALPPASATALLSGLLGSHPSVQPLVPVLIARTEGNPFFLEETVHSLVEAEALSGDRGAYRLVKAVETQTIPSTARAILSARIDRLAPEDKRLLQTASVIGKDIPYPLLEAMADLETGALRAGLSRLQQAEFLYEVQLFPELEHTFRHALTHEVTYGTLLQERRKTLHARIVSLVTRLHADRLTEHVERLAHHAVRGEMWEQAVTYLRQAGGKAMERSANREAASCFEQALAGLAHLPMTREALEQAVDLRFDLRTALFPLGEFERSLTCLREAEPMVTALDDRRRLGQLSVYMCTNLREAGSLQEALTYGRSAEAIAESLADRALRVTANMHLGAACVYAGDYRRADDLLQLVLRWLSGDLSRERFGQAGFPAVVAHAYLTWSAADQGAFADGIRHGEAAIHLAEEVDHPFSRIFGRWVLGYLRIAREEFEPAIDLLERGLAMSREWNVTLFSVLGSGVLGYAYSLAGRRAEGRPLLDHALAAMEAMGYGGHQPLFLGYLAEAHLLDDRLDDALELARRALTRARECGRRPYEARILRLLGEIAARRQSTTAQADAHYCDALALADEFGMRPLAAHCHLGLGKLRRQIGEHQRADEHLTAAVSAYRSMDMRCSLKQAEVTMAESYGPASSEGEQPGR